jgi:MoaA/NifB/PqqE/SkfB family radical SAM enzyme
VFCYASQPEYEGVDLDATTLENVITELIRMRIDVISINGHGETTIFPDWHRHARKLLDAGKALHITSNFAKYLSEDEVRTLADFKSIEISCDSADPELFSRLRRGADLETVLENLSRVKQAVPGKHRFPEFSFSCVVSDANVFELQALAELGKTMGVRHFNFCNLTRYPDVAGAINVNHISEMDHAAMIAARKAIRSTCAFLDRSGIDFQIQAGLLDTLEEKINKKKQAEQQAEQVSLTPAAPGSHRYTTRRQQGLTRNCLDPWSFLLINSRREVLPCCWHHPVGHLGFGQSLRDILNRAQMRILRQQLLTGELPLDCHECPTRGWIAPERLQKRVNRYLHPITGRVRLHGKPSRQKVITKSQYQVEYGKGWYDAEENAGIADREWRAWHWTGRSAEFTIPNPHHDFTFLIRGSVDKLKSSDQTVSIRIENELLDTFSPQSSRFQREYRLPAAKAGQEASTTFCIETNRVFIPALTEPGSRDHRELGLQVYELFLGERELAR